MNQLHHKIIGIIAISIMIMANNTDAASANYHSSKEGVIRVPNPPQKQATNPLINLKNYVISTFGLSLIENEKLFKLQDMAYFFWQQQNWEFREAPTTTRFAKKNQHPTYRSPHIK